MVLDLGLAVLNFTNWGELHQRGSVGFLDQETFISQPPLSVTLIPSLLSVALTRLRQISAPPPAQTSQPLRYQNLKMCYYMGLVVKKFSSM